MKGKLVLAAVLLFSLANIATAEQPLLAISYRKGASLTSLTKKTDKSGLVTDYDILAYGNPSDQFYGLGLRERKDGDGTRFMAFDFFVALKGPLQYKPKEKLSDSGVHFMNGLGVYMRPDTSDLSFYYEIIIGTDIAIYKWHKMTPSERSLFLTLDLKYEASKNFQNNDIIPMVGFTYQLF